MYLRCALSGVEGGYGASCGGLEIAQYVLVLGHRVGDGARSFRNDFVVAGFQEIDAAILQRRVIVMCTLRPPRAA